VTGSISASEGGGNARAVGAADRADSPDRASRAPAERAERDRRLAALAVDVLTALGERAAAIADTEELAGDLDRPDLGQHRLRPHPLRELPWFRPTGSCSS
jgi:hypothetical protein